MSLAGLARFVGALVFVDTLFYAVVTPLLPRYVEELGLSKAGAGVLAGAYPAGTLLASLPAGWLASRAGPRTAVYVGLGLLGISSLAFGFAREEWALDLARFGQGVGGACTWAGGLMWLVEAAPPARRGAMLGGAISAAIGGALLGPAVGALAEATSTRLVFGSTVLVAGGLALVASRRPPPPPVAEGGAHVGVALRRPDVLAGMWLVTLPALVFGAMTVLGSLRIDALGGGAGTVALVFLLAGAAEALMTSLTGRASDRRGRLAPVRLGLAGTALGAVALALDPGALALYGAVVVALSAALGALWAPATALLSDAAERAAVAQGHAFGLTNLAWAIGQMGGSSGGGALAKVAGDAVPLLAGALLALLTLLASRRSASRRE